MATEHRVDLATQTAVDQDCPEESLLAVAALASARRRESQRKADALHRLRDAALSDPAVADLLIVLSLEDR